MAKRFAAAQMNPCCRNFPLGYYLCQCLRLDDSSRRTRVTVQEVQAVREKPIAGGCTSFPCPRVRAESAPPTPRPRTPLRVSPRQKAPASLSSSLHDQRDKRIRATTWHPCYTPSLAWSPRRSDEHLYTLLSSF